MKIVLLTNQKRVMKFSDPAMIPADAELVWFEGGYQVSEVLAKASDAEVVIADAVFPVNREMIEGMPNLRMIHSEGVGYSAIDVEAATERGIMVVNNRAVNARQVAEHAVMLILNVLHRFAEGDAMVRAGRQMETKTRFIAEGIPDLTDKKVGIVGFGAIGRELAKRLRPFECDLYYCDAFPADAETEEALAVKRLELQELLSTCDIVSLHVPETPETYHLIDREALSSMKPNAILINTARGSVVDSKALAEAIELGVIYGCGLDTMDPEPVPADDPVLLLKEPLSYRVAVTPHTAGVTLNVFRTIYKNIWNNVAAVKNNEKPINIVNG